MGTLYNCLVNPKFLIKLSAEKQMQMLSTVLSRLNGSQLMLTKGILCATASI